MSKVEIRFMGSLKDLAGARAIEMEIKKGYTLENILSILAQRFGHEFTEAIAEIKNKKNSPYLTILINGKSVASAGDLKTIINDGDEIVITPPIGGG